MTGRFPSPRTCCEVGAVIALLSSTVLGFGKSERDEMLRLFPSARATRKRAGSQGSAKWLKFSLGLAGNTWHGTHP